MITIEILRKMIHGAYVYKLDGEIFGRLSVDKPMRYLDLSGEYIFLCHEDRVLRGLLPENKRFGYAYGYCFSRADDPMLRMVNLMTEEQNVNPQDVVSNILINILQSEIIANLKLTIKLESQLTLYDLC